MSASATLANKDGVYTTALIWTVIQLHLEAVAVEKGIVPDDCLSGSTSWVDGVIHSVDDGRGISENSLQLSIKSAFAHLAKKGIATIKHDGASPETVMDQLADWGGIPSSRQDNTGIGSGSISSVISGSNLLTEMRKVAQAGQADLFTQVGGVLTSDAWKDNTSAINFTIPSEMIKSTKLTRSNATGPSRILVRGGFISRYDEGEKVLTGSDEPDPFKNPGDGPDDPSKQGEIPTCTRNGLGIAKQEAKLRNLSGDKIDLRNGRTVASGDADIISTRVNADGTVSVVVEDGATPYMDPALRTTSIRIVGRTRPSWEWNTPNSFFTPLRQGELRRSRVLGAIGLQLGPGPSPGPLGGTNVTGGDPDSDRTSMEEEKIRIEAVVEDPDLIAEYGIIEEQIDNLYLTTHESMFAAAKRRFQEFKMQRNAWSIEIQYMPCLRLNQVVTFTTPDDDITVVGVISGLQTNFTADPPEANMTLVVESTVELGGTTYASNNLFNFPDLNGIDGTVWVGSSGTSAHGKYVSIPSGDTLSQSVEVETGVSYSLEYDVRAGGGGGGITSSMAGCGAGGSSATGDDVTVAFVASCTGTLTVTWTGTGSEGGYVARPRLFKTITA